MSLPPHRLVKWAYALRQPASKSARFEGSNSGWSNLWNSFCIFGMPALVGILTSTFRARFYFFEYRPERPENVAIWFAFNRTCRTCRWNLNFSWTLLQVACAGTRLPFSFNKVCVLPCQKTVSLWVPKLWEVFRLNRARPRKLKWQGFSVTRKGQFENDLRHEA